MFNKNFIRHNSTICNYLINSSARCRKLFVSFITLRYVLHKKKAAAHRNNLYIATDIKAA